MVVSEGLFAAKRNSTNCLQLPFNMSAIELARLYLEGFSDSLNQMVVKAVLT